MKQVVNKKALLGVLATIVISIGTMNGIGKSQHKEASVKQ